MNITLLAHAKINLWLDIKSKRVDGYHNIESIMQTVSLCDELTIERLDRGKGITMRCDDNSLDCGRTNLCTRAAETFLSSVGINEYSISIDLKKRIPISAGLGGGSTDAAAVIRALNKLFELRLSVDELCRIGVKVGADVPFCIRGKTAVVRGIGDILEECEKMPKCPILIACDGESVSTPEAYGMMDELYGDFTSRTKSAYELADTFKSGDISKIANGFYNIFESAILKKRPRAQYLKDFMLSSGALNALMSGSGPSVFGVYDELAKAEAAADELKHNGIKAVVCEPYYDNARL